MHPTHLRRAIADLGLKPCYQRDGKNFFDTRTVFDRHNFARDVRRNVRPEDWIFVKPRFLLTERGIVQFAFRYATSYPSILLFFLFYFILLIDSPSILHFFSTNQEKCNVSRR